MHVFMLIKSGKYAFKLIKYSHNILIIFLYKLLKFNTVNQSARNFEYL